MVMVFGSSSGIPAWIQYGMAIAPKIRDEHKQSPFPASLD